jgi:hypothetical protein
MDQPFVQEFPPGIPFQQQQQQQQFQQQQQPAMVQTPFGPIPNPRAQQPVNAPLNAPGQQQNSLFPQIQQPQSAQPNGQQQPLQISPGLQPGSPYPFGTQSPLGIPNPQTQQTNPNNSLFGNVPVMNPGAPPR